MNKIEQSKRVVYALRESRYFPIRYYEYLGCVITQVTGIVIGIKKEKDGKYHLNYISKDKEVLLKKYDTIDEAIADGIVGFGEYLMEQTGLGLRYLETYQLN